MKLVILNFRINLKKIIMLLQDIINRYKNDSIETINLQISDLEFLSETIENEQLMDSCFKNLNLLSFKFNNIDFSSSFFKKCSFENCIFENTLFEETKFQNCNFKNCQIKNSNLASIDFLETNFDECCFEKVEKGCLTKGWFEKCNFINTDFKGFEIMSLLQTTIEDSSFSKFNKSIKFEGRFFLLDVLSSTNGINQMWIEEH